MKCDNCKKELTESMELEHSEEKNEVYCSPDCARDRYFDHMRSGLITLEEAKERYKYKEEEE